MPSASTASINVCIKQSSPHCSEVNLEARILEFCPEKPKDACGINSNNPLVWPMDIFASERCKLQKTSPVNSSESLYKLSLPKQCSHEVKLQSSGGTSETKAYQQKEKYLSDLSAALDSSFVTSNYIPLSNNSRPWHQQSYKFSDEVFNKESGLLQYMGMLVPLKSQEAATCSRTDTFGYIPLHVRDPTLSGAFVCEDYKVPSPKMKELNDTSVPEHVRKGISYNKSDLISFNPEVSLLQ